MRKLFLAVSSVALVTPFVASTASADIVGLGANVSYWDSGLSGKATTNGDQVDIENDLDLSSDSNANLTAYLEHPLPLLPNVRLSYVSTEHTGTGNLGVRFDSIGAGADVRSDLDLSQLDLTLYYEILDNWVNLDAGLTVRKLDGELLVQEIGGTQASETDIDGVLPMGYLAARFDLPFSGVSAGAEGNFISFDGDSVYDVTAYGQYEISLLQLRAGYRQMAIDYEDGNDRLDIELDGPFISAGVTF
ncbi:TIGR04219 family outer membrane beta-barrel protein [Marinobacter salicampi]|uniref:TIGR04219 family outer membrane beta-barrel protein n=1 Tax=Marinobacter salicampi TaxID=435907 RepID=UPI00140AAA71|nr:TIGR04219 family outer membrane beta-barrel protein [Marinobacter salicampi]